MRRLVKRMIARLARTTPGKHVLHASLASEIQAERFGEVRRWPESAQGFEDLAFLFTSSQLNHGVASLRFDEAAFLYRLVRGLDASTIVEIGRFKGGSTFLIAHAMGEGSVLWSYDLHVPYRPDLRGADLDAELRTALARYGLDDDVHLVVADSRTVELPAGPVGLLFIDGDHSYEGARADVERWSPLVADGGHLLLHDAVAVGGYGNTYPGLQRLVRELTTVGNGFARVEGAGTIAAFRRQPAAAR